MTEDNLTDNQTQTTTGNECCQVGRHISQMQFFRNHRVALVADQYSFAMWAQRFTRDGKHGIKLFRQKARACLCFHGSWCAVHWAKKQAVAVAALLELGNSME
mmetsp:Transcript_47820/g.97759  ORF Transcript_47820/g.97759 Transcript_47820/m.97759 type:complete len:103 (-) Transcript_47820:19-327(-)